MIYTSDKYGKIILDTVDNYINGMKEHFDNDPIVSEEQVREGEKVLNTH